MTVDTTGSLGLLRRSRRRVAMVSVISGPPAELDRARVAAAEWVIRASGRVHACWQLLEYDRDPHRPCFLP